jgi:DNA-binding response OmpR family regulator
VSDTLLIVEDETHILGPLQDFFRAEGYTVVTAQDGEQALAQAATTPPDCVVLDVMLPKLDGIEVCRRLRAERPSLPIILLTARDSEGDRILGLDSGADDYVTKPFGMLELHARVRAQLRRMRRVKAAQAAPPPTEARFADVVVDLERRVVTRAGSAVKLSAMELKVLEYLLAHEGAVIPRNQLLNEVWGYERYPSTRTVDTHIWKLRQKFEPDPNAPVHFLTVHGIGYRFEREPEC